jgi:hypothetical protein
VASSRASLSHNQLLISCLLPKSVTAPLSPGREPPLSPRGVIHRSPCLMPRGARHHLRKEQGMGLTSTNLTTVTQYSVESAKNARPKIPFPLEHQIPPAGRGRPAFRRPRRPVPPCTLTSRVWLVAGLSRIVLHHQRLLTSRYPQKENAFQKSRENDGIMHCEWMDRCCEGM